MGVPVDSVVMVLPVKPLPVSTGAVMPIAGSFCSDSLYAGSTSPLTEISPISMRPSDEVLSLPEVVMATTAAAPTMMAIIAPTIQPLLAEPLDFFLAGLFIIAP